MAYYWTDERVTKLRELVADGISYAQIAAELSPDELGNYLTRNAISGKCHRLGISAPVMPNRPRAKRGKPKQLREVGFKAVKRSTRNESIMDASPFSRGWVKAKHSIGTPCVRAVRSEVPRPRCAPVCQEPLRVPLWELEDAMCRWPLGDAGSVCYCGVATIAKKRYCDYHEYVSTRKYQEAAQ